MKEKVIQEITYALIFTKHTKVTKLQYKKNHSSLNSRIPKMNKIVPGKRLT